MSTHPHLRLGLVGGECTGKSTLAQRIEVETGAHRVGEFLRTFVEREGRPPRQDEQGLILEAQRTMDLHACPTAIHVADPIPGMTAVYSAVYFDDHALVDRAVADSARFDVIVWCDIDIPWEPDGPQRDGPEFRAAAHAVLAEQLIPRLHDAGIPVLEVRGSVDDRWAAVHAHIREAWHP
jgi:nicotinamide riboside kinase